MNHYNMDCYYCLGTLSKVCAFTCVVQRGKIHIKIDGQICAHACFLLFYREVTGRGFLH